MNTKGRHLLVEYHGCSSQILSDEKGIQDMMEAAARAAGAHIVGSFFHRFSPQGVSGVVVVEESHLSIHTWPEVGYAACDFYTCGECQPEKAHAVLVEILGATHSEMLQVDRGNVKVGMQVGRSQRRRSRVSEHGGSRHASSDQFSGSASPPAQA